VHYLASDVSTPGARVAASRDSSATVDVDVTYAGVSTVDRTLAGSDMAANIDAFEASVVSLEQPGPSIRDSKIEFRVVKNAAVSAEGGSGCVVFA
jgi:hypothetical protein